MMTHKITNSHVKKPGQTQQTREPFNDEWTVATDREELPYVYQLLILSAPISRKGKTKIKDR